MQASHLSSSPSTATRMINRDLTQANHLLNQFTNRSATSSINRAFSQIDPTGIATSLQKRIQSPWLIKQGQSSLCGPASFFYCLAKDAPQLYIQVVLDLYTKGESVINQLRIKPSAKCLNASLPSTANMDKVDWIALASLRDSSNSAFSYDSPSDQLSGITMPKHLASWFRDAGYRHVKNDTNLIFDKGIKSLQDAQLEFSSSKNVCLFITAKTLNNKFVLSTSPDHWVALSRAITATGLSKTFTGANPSDFKNSIVSVQAFTWGYEAYELNPLKRVAGDFCDYYFGYVSAS